MRGSSTTGDAPRAMGESPPTTSEDLGTDEGVMRAFDAVTHARCTTVKGCMCIRRGKSFPDLVAVGGVRAGGSCRLEGFFFRRGWYEAVGNATRVVLSELGWDAAKRSKRVDLAMGWTREVMLGFDGIVDTKPSAFSSPKAPPFHPLEATWERRARSKSARSSPATPVVPSRTTRRC